MKGADRLAGRRKVLVKLLSPADSGVEEDFGKAETERLARTHGPKTG